MASDRANESPAIRNAGDSVEVIDPTHKLHRAVGTVAFFVGDNVYVTFVSRRGARTKMFFLDQLRAVDAPVHELSPLRAASVGAWTLLRRVRLSIAKRP